MRLNKHNKIRIYLCDLEYFNIYTSSRVSIPLNIGYIASYTLKFYGQECEVTLFKDAKKLMERIKSMPPHILGLSCYLWNLNLDIFIADQVKQLYPECIVVVGGWNIDTDPEVQVELYKRFKRNVDILIVNEGELGFSNVVSKYLVGGRKSLFKNPIEGCIFFAGSEVPVEGRDIGLSLPLETLPSPILNGLLDEFLTSQFRPMIQTSRLCPYSCTFCCSGKVKGKLRSFPVDICKGEIEYIADKYAQYAHTWLFITDENFGLMMDRDIEIAEFFVKTNRDKGYPKQVMVYFNKKFTKCVKKIAHLLGDMNSMGVTLPLQSLNIDALRAVKRINLTKAEIYETINWARAYKLEVSTELIYGLPYETKKTFLQGVEYLISIKVNMVLIQNLILIMGSQLYRKSERDRFNLITKYRPASETNYDEINGEFVCETEEVVVSSSHSTFSDYIDIRKLSFLFWATFNVGYFNKLISYLIDQKKRIIPFFDEIMNPSQNNFQDRGYERFIKNFVNNASSELFETEKEVIEHIQRQFRKNNNRITSPTKLNSWYASRLIYQEKWFGSLVSYHLFADESLKPHKRILKDLITISENEWIDLSNLEVKKSILVSENTIDFLKIEKPISGAREYILKLSLSQKQKEIISSFLKNYSAEDPSFYFNALIWIQPRKSLRYELFTVEDFQR